MHIRTVMFHIARGSKIQSSGDAVTRGGRSRRSRKKGSRSKEEKEEKKGHEEEEDCKL